MIPRRILPVTLLALILAACDGSSRQSRFPTAPGATALPPPAPAPSPPLPPSGPPEDRPIPGSGPIYRPGVGTTAVASGQTVEASITPTDLDCWPEWDASARCKVFEITAPFDGTLAVTVRLASPTDADNLDLFLIDPGRAYVISSSGINAEEASLPVTARSRYGLAVMAYHLPVEFQLRVEVTGR